MGRRRDPADFTRRGPGRKSRKQKDPTFQVVDREENGTDIPAENNKKIKTKKEPKGSGNINHRRERKRLFKQAEEHGKKRMKRIEKATRRIERYQTEKTGQSSSEGEEDDDEEDEEEEEMEVDESEEEEEAESDDESAESDEEIEQPTKKMKLFEDEDDSDEEDDDEEEEEDIDDDFEKDMKKTGGAGDASEMNGMSDSSDEEDSDDEEDSEDEEDDDLLPVEKAAKKLEKKKKKLKQMSDAEMLDSIKQQSDPVKLPSKEELEQEAKDPDLGMVQHRIKSVIQVLANFKKHREGNKSRKDYIDQLRKDLCFYYNYTEFLMTHLMDLFPKEILDFLDASEMSRPVTIRTNTLKIKRKNLAMSLINRGVNLDPIGKWSKVGLVVFDTQVPLGATPEYFAGYYMLQGGASMLPVMALNPVENEAVLDLCAAPGGKTTYIAQMMRNTGYLVANDANKERCKAITGNLHRFGVTNTIVCNMDGRDMPKVMSQFDRVLVDAPCSGTGVISKDPSVKSNKLLKDIQRCSHLQKELILAAIDCSKKHIVYSTCSVMVEENEEVIQYALSKRHVKIVDTGLSFGVDGFTNYKQHRFIDSMRLCKRFYPHTHNLDGFFVCRLEKLSDANSSIKNGPLTPKERQEIVEKKAALKKKRVINEKMKKLSIMQRLAKKEGKPTGKGGDNKLKKYSPELLQKIKRNTKKNSRRQ